jgi:cell division septum initiation protein DivIVA
MALSFSRPDPSSPSALAAANFSHARRGFDPNEVRELLRMVAAEMARLQEREKFLERELRTAQRSSPNSMVSLDEDTVTRMLGEEAARILAASREAASQIKIRAEEGAARLLREATDEAQRMREEAAVEAARRRQDASADAEAELQMAKQQGREMVNEARAYRERVLSELSRRRELARQQIEQLVHGRDRLLQAFERARLVSVDVMAELTPLGEPGEYVNLAPITGPVPVMLPAEPRVADAGESDEGTASHDLDDAESVTDATTMLERPDVDDIDDATEPTDETTNAATDTATDGDQGDDDHAPVVTLYAGEVDHPALSSDDDAEPARKADVDDLFARLRAARVDTIGADAAADATDEAADTGATDEAAVTEMAESADADDAAGATLTIVGEELAVFQRSPEQPAGDVTDDDSPFGRRDAALTPIIVAAARRMKRVLADEQNEVLAALRRNERVRTLDTMLPWAADHAERYSAAIDKELQQAALAGSASVSDATEASRKSDIKSAKALRPAQDAVLANLVTPLRERLERAVAEAADNDDIGSSVRAIYREWKTQRIDEHLDDIVRIAFGRGALAALNPGSPVCWIVDPHGPACPDAEDNALAGVVGAGDAFPTDHTFAPAHAGCRCMVVPADAE